MKSILRKIANRFSQYLVREHLRPHFDQIKAQLSDLSARLDHLTLAAQQASGEHLALAQHMSAAVQQATADRSAASARIGEQLAELAQASSALGQQLAFAAELLTDLAELGEHSRKLDQLQAALGAQKAELGEHSRKLDQLQAALGAQTAELSELRALLSRQQELALRDLYVIRQTLDPEQAHFALRTDAPIAADSPDHIVPWGTANDDTRDAHFNEKLYEFMAYHRPLYVLDLGCAGGGFVRSLLEDGHFALGLEGSDYSQKRWRAQWGNIPHHLKTCDITKPFAVLDRETSERVLFDVITAWEVIEHIPEADLDQLFRNILDHLKADGYFMGSVCTVPDVDPKTGANWHQSVYPREWWLERFRAAGFEVVEQDAIGKDDWLRGSGRAPLDWTEDQGAGFHVVLRVARTT